MTDIQKYNTDKTPLISDIKDVQDRLKKEFNKAPNPKSVKVNKYAGNSKYVPIGIVQGLLDRLFISWDWRINDVKVIMNGVMVRGTLTCLTPGGNTINMDGIGASEFQLKKGESTLTPDTLNSKAIERDVPKAEAEALKSAAKKLGRIFGRSLNRDEDFMYVPDDDLLNRIFNIKNEENE